jgi:hypothetical protein
MGDAKQPDPVEVLREALSRALDVMERPWNNCDDSNLCSTDCYEAWHEDRKEAIRQARAALASSGAASAAEAKLAEAARAERQYFRELLDRCAWKQEILNALNARDEPKAEAETKLADRDTLLAVIAQELGVEGRVAAVHAVRALKATLMDALHDHALTLRAIRPDPRRHICIEHELWPTSSPEGW